MGFKASCGDTSRGRAVGSQPMNGSFVERAGVLHAEGVALTRIAEACGTPTYVYSRAQLEARYRSLVAVLAGVDHAICYDVKANRNLGVLATFARLGAGFDIVSGGELERVLRAGGDPRRVVFSGVGKTELRRAHVRT